MKASPWDGKIKDFKLEPASFSQMVHCLLVLVLVLVLLLVLVLVVRLGHHDGWMIAILLCPTFPLMTSTLTCYRFKCTSSLFCFPPPSPLFGTQTGGGLKRRGKISLVYSQEEKKLVKQIIWIFIAARFYVRRSTCSAHVSMQYSWVLVFLLRAFKIILLSQVSVGVLKVSVGAYKEAVPALARRHMREGLAIQMGAK